MATRDYYDPHGSPVVRSQASYAAEREANRQNREMARFDMGSYFGTGDAAYDKQQAAAEQAKLNAAVAVEIAAAAERVRKRNSPFMTRAEEDAIQSAADLSRATEPNTAGVIVEEDRSEGGGANYRLRFAVRPAALANEQEIYDTARKILERGVPPPTDPVALAWLAKIAADDATPRNASLFDLIMALHRRVGELERKLDMLQQIG